MAQAIYDVVIVGGGPGGLTAAMYAARARMKALVVEKARPGGQAATTQEMENFPGFPEGKGPALMDLFAGHAKHFGAEIVKDEVVDLDLKADDKVVLGKKGTYKGKTVVLAPGAEPRVLGVKGERAFRGKGVSYCATCDADFYADLDVVVVGNGDAAIEEAMYLTKFANKVTIIVIHDVGILDANKVAQERAMANPKIEWVWNSVLDEIRGDGIVEEVVVKNIKTGALSTLETNGVFFFVGTVPKTDFLKGHVDLDPKGYIITNELMETSVDGVYAVGDARVKYLRQVITAAADGAIAAVASEKYLQEEEGFRSHVLESDKPVLVYFWAPQVDESLKAMATVEKMQTDSNGALKLHKIDTYRNARVAKRYQITEAPTLLLFQNGQVARRMTAAELKSAAGLDEVTKTVANS